jgi:peroxiredoxin
VAHLTSLPSLTKLDLGKRDFDRKNPPITDVTTVRLKAIRSLEQLSVRADGLTDTGLDNLAELCNLRQLELPIAHAVDPKNYLSPYTEKGIEALTRIRSLESLTLGGPGVTDAALSHVGRMTNLRSLMLFGCPIGNAGLARLSALQSLETLTLMIPSEVTVSGLNSLSGLSRLSNLRADSLKQDGVALDISQLTQLEYLMLSTGKGSNFRDEDFACLANLKRLKWLQVGAATDITDAGMIHLSGLSALDRLSIRGSALTDRGLAVLANMPRLDSVNISGTFTDVGLQYLEGLTGLRSLTIYSANTFSPAAKQRLRQHLPNLYRLTADGERTVGNTNTASAHPKPGTLAPDFTVSTLDGANFTLSKQRGKVVLLHFWATWCTPCVKGLPAMKTFHDRMKRKYGDRVVLLDLAMDDSEAKLRSVVAAHKLTAPQARIGLNSKLAASYGVTGAPDAFMIGPDGRILLNRESPEGPGDTEAVIDRALAAMPPQ